jgi:hypothetical protein
MKVGDLIKLNDDSIGLVITLGVLNHGASYFIIHTGEVFYPDLQRFEGWEKYESR